MSMEDIKAEGVYIPRAKPGALPDIEDICWDDHHETACARGDHFYVDPCTGLTVMTRVKHLARGVCCGNGCRHCAYAHENVKDEEKPEKIQVPSVMHVPKEGALPTKATALFWSGGKDSLLALRAMLAPRGSSHLAGARSIVLVTTFDASSRKIPHRDVHCRDVVAQARHLDLALVGVPLHGGGSDWSGYGGYVPRLRAAIDAVRARGCEITDVACGDLHLARAREWREAIVGDALGLEVRFPLWRATYEKLEADLASSGVVVKVTAVRSEAARAAGVRVGATFGEEFCAALRRTKVDARGENGEFHTFARVWETTRERALGVDVARAAAA